MATPSQYELGNLLGNHWKQWANAAGQDYYQDLNSGVTQFEIPAGYEDSPQDTWTIDTSKGWQQWRNDRTQRVRRTHPTPPAPRTYLDLDTTKAHLQLVERIPESHESLYRKVIMAILRYFFDESEDFDVFQESRGVTSENESKADIAVLKILCPPGGNAYAYDYCLVKSKRAGESWAETEDQLSRRCGGTFNDPKQVYGIMQVGLEIQFFKANAGVLINISNCMHVRNDVAHITTMIGYLKRHPLAVQ